MTIITVYADITTDTKNYQNVNIDDQETVSQLKNTLKPLFGYENSNANIFYMGKLLDTNRSLFSYNIKNNSYLNIVLRVRN